MAMLELGFSWFGFFALSLAMKHHFGQLRPRAVCSPVQAAAYRVLGGACLVAGAIVCALDQGGVIGIVAWIGWLSVGAFLQAMLLTIAPRARERLRRLDGKRSARSTSV